MLKIFALFPVLIASLIVWYVFFENKTNHSSFDLMTFSFFLCILIVFFIFKRTEFVAKVGIALSIISILFIFYLDQNNYMVQYDRWTKRGLPEKGEPSENYFQWFVEPSP
jgi:uncharacterized membrane protein YwaF